MPPTYITEPLTLLAADLQPGWCQAIGPITLSTQEVIDFARQFDPQPVHIDPEFAAQTRFRGIVASGLQVYITYHVRWWVHMVRTHFICGLSFDGAVFHGPVYPEMPVYSVLWIDKTDPKPEKGTVAVTWRWEFLDGQERPLQTARFTTYHSQTDRPPV